MDGILLPAFLLVVAAALYGASRMPRFRQDTVPPTPTPEDRLQAYTRRRGLPSDHPDLLHREAKGLAYKRWLLSQNETYRHNRIRAGEPI